jgi:hypothetical protein
LSKEALKILEQILEYTKNSCPEVFKRIQLDMVHQRAISIIGELMINIPSLKTLNDCLKILHKLSEGIQAGQNVSNPTQEEILKYMLHDERASGFFHTLEKACISSIDSITDVNKQFNLYHLRRVSRGSFRF